MFVIKDAAVSDLDVVRELIFDLACYEKMQDECKTSVELLKVAIFDEKVAKCVIAYNDNVAVGFAVYFYNFSTFECKKGLYLEDFFIRPQYRNMGFGTKIFKYLAKLALQNNCARFEWCCLNWNTPSIEFYKKTGAKAMDEWTTYRLNADDIKKYLD